MINEQELAEAVDRLREGDDYGLLVKQHEVIESMARNEKEIKTIINSIIDGFLDLPIELTNELFDDTAKSLLKEALRSKQEMGAGL